MPAAQETAAGVNEVGDVAFALVFVGLDEWLTQAANDFGRGWRIRRDVLCRDVCATRAPKAPVPFSRHSIYRRR